MEEGWGVVICVTFTVFSFPIGEKKFTIRPLHLLGNSAIEYILIGPGNRDTESVVKNVATIWSDRQNVDRHIGESKCRVGINFGQIWQFLSASSSADDAVTAPKELCRGTHKRDIDKLAQSLAAEKANDDGNPSIEGLKTLCMIAEVSGPSRGTKRTMSFATCIWQASGAEVAERSLRAVPRESERNKPPRRHKMRGKQSWSRAKIATAVHAVDVGPVAAPAYGRKFGEDAEEISVESDIKLELFQWNVSLVADAFSRRNCAVTPGCRGTPSSRDTALNLEAAVNENPLDSGYVCTRKVGCDSEARIEISHGILGQSLQPIERALRACYAYMHHWCTYYREL
ncbi:hypothetical protein B0H13DRAFT_1851040 [Mycena leptocephala]|nr:hypothetical protein B0H13DRAFT_1851040 [Mycena leptocephala]